MVLVVRKARDCSRGKDQGGQQGGRFETVSRKEGSLSHVTKDPWWETGMAMESDLAPERPLGIPEPAAARAWLGPSALSLGVGAPD